MKPNGVNGKVSLLDANDFNMNLAPSANGVVSWKVQEVDLDNDELVDEDSLLTEEDLKKPEVSAGILSALSFAFLILSMLYVERGSGVGRCPS